EKQLAQTRNLLATLSGRFASEGLPAAFELQSFRLPRRLPLSLPADLVRQRPDVRVAEANLHAANAQVGVAIANRLPQITLTANAGSTADSISRLFSPGTLFWTIAGNATQTVFDAGSAGTSSSRPKKRPRKSPRNIARRSSLHSRTSPTCCALLRRTR